MPNRTETLRAYIDDALLGKPEEWRKIAYTHLYGVAQACALVAMKRGENAELATMAGMLHDFYVFRSGRSQDDHAAKGAQVAREVLDALGLTSGGETERICVAIRNHSDKGGRFDGFTEVLVDADVMQHCLYDVTMPVAEREKERFGNLLDEFGLNEI